jgi:hypothetical protein
MLGLHAAARWVQPSFGAAVSGLLLYPHVSGLIFRVVQVGWVRVLFRLHFTNPVLNV